MKKYFLAFMIASVMAACNGQDSTNDNLGEGDKTPDSTNLPGDGATGNNANYGTDDTVGREFSKSVDTTLSKDPSGKNPVRDSTRQ